MGPEKLKKALRYFAEWVQARGLRPIGASYTRRTSRGTEALQVTADGNPESEKFYRTRYAPPELSERKTKQLAEKKCAADAPERAARRAQAATHREAEDVQFAQLVTQAILRQFPGCPPPRGNKRPSQIQ